MVLKNLTSSFFIASICASVKPETRDENSFRIREAEVFLYEISFLGTNADSFDTIDKIPARRYLLVIPYFVKLASINAMFLRCSSVSLDI
jgi:hypothetical protein